MGGIGPGDVVVCVKTPSKGLWPLPTDHPVQGKLYRVTQADRTTNMRVGLKLREVSGPFWWNAKLFRKLEKGDDVFSLAEPRKVKEDA